MVERDAIVGHEKLHARPAALLVQRAKQFSSDVKLEKDGTTVNAKSPMGVMRLGAGRGDVIRVIASGPDEEAAADALEAYVAGGGS
ncbi:MAG: HPr family phosphocarrier protein [Actinomycetota bacterium]|jgi:phosphotransferase system HPr (HPr) family protein|nr:HPr family phosphocarrier protein [Rubrobacter sp.]MDQ3238880.1 HPr family phosphocarrier protein [Actinomycetota bacterium]